MIICMFILLGQATHLFWHDEPPERLSHKIVQLGQAVAQLNQRTAVVAALRLRHGRLTISRSVKYSRDQQLERRATSFLETATMRAITSATSAPSWWNQTKWWNWTSEFCLLDLEPPTCVCFLVPGQSSHFHWSPEPTIEPRHLGHTALVTWDENINILKQYFLFLNFFKTYFQLFVFLTPGRAYKY